MLEMQPPPRVDQEKRASLLHGAQESWRQEQRRREIEEQNDNFIDDAHGQAMLMEREQDESLDVLHKSVLKIGELGLGIHNELNSQSKCVTSQPPHPHLRTRDSTPDSRR